jgi:hypothetical protein
VIAPGFVRIRDQARRNGDFWVCSSEARMNGAWKCPYLNQYPGYPRYPGYSLCPPGMGDSLDVEVLCGVDSTPRWPNATALLRTNVGRIRLGAWNPPVCWWQGTSSLNPTAGIYRLAEGKDQVPASNWCTKGLSSNLIRQPHTLYGSNPGLGQEGVL